MNETDVSALIEEVYDRIMEKPKIILGIFNDFFNEANVDMQNYKSLSGFKCWANHTSVRNYINIDLLSPKDKEELGDKALPELSQSTFEKVAEIIKQPDALDKITYEVGSFTYIRILVHFPHVTITNENGKFLEINHLYAEININYRGQMCEKFGLNRSDYSVLHLCNNYMTSHVRQIPTHDFTEFQSPCLGDGPISNTVYTLMIKYDEGIWNLFCLELSKYVTVESLSGIPYHRLEDLNFYDKFLEGCRFTVIPIPPHFDCFPKEKIKEFVRYFVNSKKLKFNYEKGSYSIGMTLIDYIILISNEFIAWYNEQSNEDKISIPINDLKREGLIRDAIIENGRIYYVQPRRSEIIDTYDSFIGKKVCTFKGKDITITISDRTTNYVGHKNIFLNVQLSLFILNICLKVLNYRYGRNKATTQRDKIGTEVWYI